MEEGEETMKIFLVCTEPGGVINVISGKSFEKAYRNTVGSNYGELLVEVDEQTLKEIIAEAKKIGIIK